MDIALEQGMQALAGVEIKASGTVREDFRGLRKLKEIAGPRFVCGVVLYDGDVGAPFADDLFAVSLWALWN